MNLRDHTILGGAASIILYPFTGLNVLWFFGASVLIDIDHYLDFIYHTGLKDLAPKRMFQYHNSLQRWWQDPAFLNMEVFHTVEFLSLIVILALILSSRALWALFFGLIFHIALDLVFLYRHGIFNKRIHSIAGYFLKKRKMARVGLDPARLYNEAVALTSTAHELKKIKGTAEHQHEG
jgi:hypothetical protein